MKCNLVQRMFYEKKTLDVAVFILMERLSGQARIFTLHTEPFFSAARLRCRWHASVASQKASCICWGRRKTIFHRGYVNLLN